MANAYKGKCFCGNVEFELTGSPVVMGYCHCKDCTGWLGAPIHALSIWPKDTVRVTKGEAGIGTFNKTENSYRKFCKNCGGTVMVDHPGMGMIDVPSAVVADLKHVPTLHVYYASKTIAMKDGLPKFKDLPADFGGSGETLPE